MILAINTKDAVNGSIDIDTGLRGTYELIHQYIDYHTNNAVDYTCNELIAIDENEESYAVTFSDQTVMNTATLVSEFNAESAPELTASVNGSIFTISLDALSLVDYTISLSTSSARLLFTKVEDVLLQPGQSHDFELRDRTNVKYYVMNVTGASNLIHCSNEENSTLILSSYDEQPIGQLIHFSSTTETFDFIVKEYNSLVNLDNNDIPTIHLIFKKKDNRLPSFSFWSSHDYTDSKTLSFDIPLGDHHIVLYTWMFPHNLPIVWDEIDGIVTDEGTIRLGNLYTFSSASISTAIESGTSRTVTGINQVGDIYEFVLDGPLNLLWSNINSTFKYINNETVDETGATSIFIDTSLLPETQPHLIQCQVAESFNTVAMNPTYTFGIPMYENSLSQQHFRIHDHPMQIQLEFYRNKYPLSPIILEGEWAVLVIEP